MTSRERILKDIARLQEELAALPARPPEPSDDFTTPQVVLFHLSYGDDDRRNPYTFAAIKLDSHWWVTGSNSPNRVTWDGLWRWIEECGGLAICSRMSVVSDWAPVTEIRGAR